MEIVGHLIDGKNVTENISTMPLTNPATGIQVSELAMASAEQTRSAIEAASRHTLLASDSAGQKSSGYVSLQIAT